MKQYLDLVRHMWKTVVKRSHFGAQGRVSLVYQMRFDLNDGFPMVTTKRNH
jgi:thymidylate synthase